MLIVRGISRGVVRYFLDGRHPGNWSEGADHLLGLAGPVDARQLSRVLDGRDPATDQYLASRRAPRRRAGWDLIFTAPKSVSLLASSVGPELSETVKEAHTSAVSAATGYVDERLTVRSRDGAGRPRPAEGLIAAAFEHTSNAAEEPHLHTHLLVANLSRADGTWGAVDNEDWFVGRGALGALYQLELRHQLKERGWDLDWRLRPDGLADLADVGRETIRAASTQSRRVASIGRFEARRQAQPAARTEHPVFDGRAAAARPGPTSPEALGLADAGLERAVKLRLAGRRSDFRRADVMVALASCYAKGASAPEAAGWVDRFCAGSIPVVSPTAGARWTTDVARRGDEDLVRLLGARLASCTSEADLGADRTLRGTRTAESLVREMTAGAVTTHFLGSRPGQTSLLAQAELIAACRDRWEQSGCHVALSSPTPQDALRWAVLTGVEPFRPGDRPDVLIVDCADRRTSVDLLRLIRSVRGADGRIVFVEGGTRPRLTNPASHGLVEAAALAGPHFLPTPEPWAPLSAVLDRPGIESVGRRAAEDLLRRWQLAPDPPLLVGLGIEEVRALNRAAVGEERPGSGSERFRLGDRVVVLKGGPGLPRCGTFGTVVEAPPIGERDGRNRHEPGIRASWDSVGAGSDAARSTGERIEGPALAGLGFGYAVTPGMAARSDRSLMVLGPASALGRARERVVAEIGREPPGRQRELARDSM